MKSFSAKALAAITVLSLAVMSTTFMVVKDYIAAFQTEAEFDRIDELLAAGYPENVILDQIAEEFYNGDGLHGTGGLDGKYLDGSIAPNGILAGSESSSDSGSSTTQKPVHSHSYDEGVATKDATCTEEGTMTYTCSCGETKTETLPLTDHDWQQTAEHEGNCIEKAKVDLACYNCGATSTLEFSYGGHAYEPSSDSTLPTCTEDGTQIKICSVCGDVWTYTLPAKGHIERTYRLAEPTFWSNGLDTIKCKVCYTHFRDITVIATGGNLRYVILGAVVLAICGSIATVIFVKKKRTNKG